MAYVGDLSHGGSAVIGNNDIIFSACMVGDFTKELPTDAQIHSAHDLADWFLHDMPQYPLIISWDTSIIGHKDAYSLLHLPGSTPTACPGTSWPNDMKDRIKDNVPYTPAPTPVPPVPPTVDYKALYDAEVLKTKDLTAKLAASETDKANLLTKINQIKGIVNS